MRSPFAPQPPLGFRPAGLVAKAWMADPPALRKKRYTGSRLLGVKYEAKVQEDLLARHEGDYIANPWLCFQNEGSPALRWCQPDGLLFNWREGHLTLVEIKYQHTALAWWQLRHLYFPVLLKVFPQKLWEYSFCEITKWYDPQILFPVEVSLARDPAARCAEFKVHIWKP